jgi:hypothetical protein
MQGDDGDETAGRYQEAAGARLPTETQETLRPADTARYEAARSEMP